VQDRVISHGRPCIMKVVNRNIVTHLHGHPIQNACTPLFTEIIQKTTRYSVCGVAFYVSPPPPPPSRAVIAQSVQRWATGWTIGVLGFDARWRLEIFLFTTASRTALEPTEPPIQWVPWALSLGVKRPGRETNHSPPSSAEVKECVELYLHYPIRLHGVVLSQQKHRDNFTFTFYVHLPTFTVAADSRINLYVTAILHFC
jgi:hypothetical protein